MLFGTMKAFFLILVIIVLPHKVSANLNDDQQRARIRQTIDDVFDGRSTRNVGVKVTLRADKTVTISLIAPRIASLKQYLTGIASTSNVLLAGCFGIAGLEALDLKIKEMDLTAPLAAAFLDPLVKGQLQEIEKIVPAWNIQKAKSIVGELAQKYIPAIRPTVPGSRKIDFPVNIVNVFEDELLRYSTTPSLNIDPLKFWKTNEEAYPILAKVAKEILCIPASSAPSERAFSTLQLVATDLRSRLKTEKVSSIIMLRSLIKNNFFTSAINPTID